MSYSLVIIDMQREFQASNSYRVIQSCIREIRQAIKDRAGILFVRYEGSGPVQPRLMREVATYSRWFPVSKRQNNGSIVILNALRRHRFSKKMIKVCGVNTHACVRQTVEGLSSRAPNSTIQVIADACNGNYSHQEGLQAMAGLPNCTIINGPTKTKHVGIKTRPTFFRLPDNIKGVIIDAPPSTS